MMRDKLVVHEGLTQLQEMRLEMLRTVLWRIIVVPVMVTCAGGLLALAIGWFLVCFVWPLVQLSH